MRNIIAHNLIIVMLLVTLCGCGTKQALESDRVEPEIEVIEENSTAEEMYEIASSPESDTEEPGEHVDKIEEDIDTIRIVMVGDMLLHTRVYESGMKEDGTLNYDHLFKHTGNLISEADIAIVNEEVILGGSELGLSGYPAFNGPYEVADALVNTGFDVILQATNHALDKGSRGILNNITYWENNYPDEKVIGIHDEASDLEKNYAIIETKGIKIAVLNYTYGTNGIIMPEDMPYLVNMLDEQRVAADMAAAKDEADFVIVCPHWGTEYIHTADSSQKKWAQFFADNGANLVIGTHPHVIEPIEYYGDCPVYYSIGNYVNATSGEGNGTADRMLGAAACVTLNLDSGQVTDTICEAIPLVSHIDTSARQQLTVYPLEEYSEELAASNEIIKQDSSFSTEYLWNVWNSVFKCE